MLIMKKYVFWIFLTVIFVQCTEIESGKNQEKTDTDPENNLIGQKPQNNSFQEGDLIFQVSLSSQSKAIQLATHSKYSHMGVILKKGNEFYVFEAIQPVTFTPLKKWIERGENNHFVVKRLKNGQKILSEDKILEMKNIGKEYLGKNYDIYFGWSDERIYCSELVWKIYKKALNIEIGKLSRLKDFDLSHAEVKNKLKERYGNNIPLDEKVISPKDMFESEVLEEININKF